ncbi:MAG: CPBP family glutamic-type intramembrane protease [Acidobacteriota bacterium]
MRLLTATFKKRSKISAATTWFAFCLALTLALPQPPNLMHVAFGALLGAFVVLAGFATTQAIRPLPTRSSAARVRLSASSLAAGATLGATLLTALVLAVRFEPALAARFAGRTNEAAWRPLALAFESSILEEVVFRLFVLSLVAWVVLRLVKRPVWAVSAGVAASTALFAMAHLPAWSAVATSTPMLFASVLLLNAVGGLLFAWVFWRWGLPYAILCHLAGDMVVQSLAPRLLH